MIGFGDSFGDSFGDHLDVGERAAACIDQLQSERRVGRFDLGRGQKEWGIRHLQCNPEAVTCNQMVITW